MFFENSLENISIIYSAIEFIGKESYLPFMGILDNFCVFFLLLGYIFIIKKNVSLQNEELNNLSGEKYKKPEIILRMNLEPEKKIFLKFNYKYTYKKLKLEIRQNASD